ncbi:LysR family transcriptional regulator [Streptomyces sp. NPDC004065]|uniref:LysR family transcriptional regulator n=1 Tax=Streptomyces sp. NPDC004065 TaxID=3364689 RepID=UPI003850C606
MVRADDLGIFLEVARHGRLTEAAKVLELNHTTVGRHISRLEQSVQQRLFHREPSGWTLTEPGLRLLAHAEAVEAAVRAANEDCLLTGQHLTGSVRVVAPDGFGSYLLVPNLGQFAHQLGNLVVEVVTANRHASLTSREFDVAVTIERPQARGVKVSKLADYRLGFFGSPDYLAKKPQVSRPEELTEVFDLIWYVDEALGPDTYKTLYTLVPDAVPHIQTNSISAQINAAQRGMGLAFLPTYIGASTPGLVRLRGMDRTVPHSYWLLVPNNFERLARVMTVTRLLQQLVHETDGLAVPRRQDPAAG